MEWIIQIVSGAVGGNIAGKAMQNFSLGPILNSLVGIIGGGLGGQILSMVGLGGVGDIASSPDIANILTDVAGSGVGGAVLLVVVGLIKKAFSK